MATMIVPVSFTAGVTADQMGITKTEAIMRSGYWLPVAIPVPPAGLQVGTTFADGGVRMISLPQTTVIDGGEPDGVPISGQIWPRP